MILLLILLFNILQGHVHDKKVFNVSLALNIETVRKVMPNRSTTTAYLPLLFDKGYTGVNYYSPSILNTPSNAPTNTWPNSHHTDIAGICFKIFLTSGIISMVFEIMSLFIRKINHKNYSLSFGILANIFFGVMCFSESIELIEKDFYNHDYLNIASDWSNSLLTSANIASFIIFAKHVWFILYKALNGTFQLVVVNGTSIVCIFSHFLSILLGKILIIVNI